MDIRFDARATAEDVAAYFGSDAADWEWCPECERWSCYADDPYGDCYCC